MRASLHDQHPNNHGVPCVWKTTGNHFGHKVDGIFRTNQPIEIPITCLDCHNYDDGEYGDYGSRLSPPYCEKNVWWPTKSGVCKKRNPAPEATR